MGESHVSDPQHDERVELRGAYKSLLTVESKTKELISNPSVSSEEEASILDGIRVQCVQLRGVRTNSKLARFLERLSNDILSAIDDFCSSSEREKVLGNTSSKIMDVTQKGKRAVDTQLDKLRERIVRRDSFLIDERMGNYRFTVFGLVSLIYLGGLVFVAYAWQLNLLLTYMLILFVVITMAVLVDLFFVVWTKPFWLYLPSVESLAGKLINWDGLWTLLVPIAGLLVAAILYLVELILSLVPSSDVFMGLAIGTISLVSTAILYRYAQWRKGEYLGCPNPRCAHLTLPKPSALLIHYEESHGIDLRKAVAELRSRLAKKKKKKERRFRNYLGYSLLAISWFFCFETIFYLRTGDIISSLILFLADAVLIWWGLYELHIRLEPIPSGIPRPIVKQANSEAANAAMQFVLYPMFIKGLLVGIIMLSLANFIGAETVYLISTVTFYNSGFTQALALPHFRKKFRREMTDLSKWNKLFSRKRCIVWIVAIYTIFSIMGFLAFMGNYDFLIRFRFSYITSDLIIFAWSSDLFSTIKNQKLQK